MKAYEGILVSGFLLFASGLSGFLLGILSPGENSILSPVILALGVLFMVAGTFRSKKDWNRMFYWISVVLALAVMLFGEYIFAPVQNRMIFYILTAVLAVTFLGLSYFILTPEKTYTRQKKILSWSVSILFALTFYGLIAVVYSNLQVALTLGLLVVVLFVISRLIHRKRIPKVPY